MVEREATRRRAFLATAGAALSAAVAGCNGDDGTGTTATTTTTTTATTTTTPGRLLEGEVLELTAPWVGTLDPVAAAAPTSEAVVENVFDGLVTFPDGRPGARRQLAADVDVSFDGTTYTVELVEASFHDGTPVTADDVVYSFERLAASPNSRWSDLVFDVLGIVHETDDDGGGGTDDGDGADGTDDEGGDGRGGTDDGDGTDGGNATGGYRPGSLGVTAVDDRTVEIRLEEPFHAALDVLAYPQFSVVPEGIVGDVAGYDGDREYASFAADPVGSGPFELVAWERGEQVACERFADYHGEVGVDGVRWRVIDDPGERYWYGLEGPGHLVDVHDDAFDPAAVGIDRTDEAGRAFGTYGPVGDGRTLEYLSVPLVDTFYVGFDMSDVPKAVRRAVAMAVDQHALVRRAFDGRATPAYHLTPPGIYPRGEYEEHAATSYPHGYGERRGIDAGTLLENAGYGSGSGDYELRWTQYSSEPLAAAADVVDGWLDDLPINLRVETVPFDTLLARRRAGDLEAYAFRTIPDWPAPGAFLSALYPGDVEPTRPAAEGFVDWTGAAGAGEADALDRARTAAANVVDNPRPTELARETREEAYVALEEANWEDIAILPLFHRAEQRIAVEGADVEPFGAMGSHRQAFDDARIDGG